MWSMLRKTAVMGHCRYKVRIEYIRRLAKSHTQVAPRVYRQNALRVRRAWESLVRKMTGG